MSFSAQHRTHLSGMRLVERVSQALHTASWVWGGYTTDIYVGRMLREHNDLDYLTLDLHRLYSKIAAAFSKPEWRTKKALCFPLSWLSRTAMPFYGVQVHVVAPELQYILKEHPELLNPDWQIREKDILEKAYLEDLLLGKGIELCSLHNLVKISSD